MKELGFLVTFIPNKIEPIHNWYWYKEGYSKRFVDLYLKRFGVTKDSIVLDPFCGVGTTLLACKQSGISSVGFDVSPLCIFASKVKTQDYDMESLEKYVKEALKWKFQKPDQIPREKWLMRIFSKYALEDIVFFKRKISEIPDEKARDFLTLALIDSSMKSSYAYKDGAFVKVKKRSVPPIKKMFSYKMRRMLRDLREAKLAPVPTRVEIADARMLPLEDNSIDFVMTSPPYLNKIEYTNIYKTEYSLFFSMPETKLRSFIGERVEDSGDMPPVAEAYFNDMKKVMQELYRVCKPGAKLAIVIGGGCFPEKVVEVDRILANMSEEIGFKFIDMIVARENWCTRNRTIKVGSMRESIIILEKA